MPVNLVFLWFCGTAECKIRKVFGSMNYAVLWLLFRSVSQVNAVVFLLWQCTCGTFSVWYSSFLIYEVMSLCTLEYIHSHTKGTCIYPPPLLFFGTMDNLVSKKKETNLVSVHVFTSFGGSYYLSFLYIPCLKDLFNSQHCF